MMALDFAVSQIVPTEGPAVFVLRAMPGMQPIDPVAATEAWRVLWSRAGAIAPPLLVMDSAAELLALSGAELRVLGLMRIPEGKVSP